jgi:hypothetical protein
VSAPLDPSGGFPATIPRQSRADRNRDPIGFWALRSLAIARSQAASGAVWTDYNLHDPGVTTLEAFSFALTELGFRAGFPVADQLCGPGGEIHYQRQGLFEPAEILTARALTALDYRKVVLDAIMDVSEVRVAPPQGDGLFRLQLLLAHDDPATRRGVRPETRKGREEAPLRALAVCRRERTLGEDFDEAVGAIDVAEIDLVLSARISGGRDPEDIVADIFDRCADAIAPPAPVVTLEDLRAKGRRLDEIFEGPAVRHGFIELPPQDPPAIAGRTLSDRLDALVAEVRSRILRVAGVADVSRLELRPRDAEQAADKTAMPRLLAPWPGEYGRREASAPDAPPPLGAADLSLITLTRTSPALRGATIPGPPTDAAFDPEEVASRFEDLRAGHRRARQSARSSGEKVVLPSGVWRDRQAFYSIAHHFPPLYRLTEAPPGLPDDDRRGFRTYLAILDQALSALSGQIDHLRNLFVAQERPWRSYWPSLLDEASVPGITALYDKPVAEIEAEVFGGLAGQVDRRNRLLDYLLSLYGETYDQTHIAQFLSHLDSVETSAFLLGLKTRFLENVTSLGRDRAGGADYSSATWHCGYQNRLAYLVGFEAPEIRSLTEHLRLDRATPGFDLLEGSQAASGEDSEPDQAAGSGPHPSSGRADDARALEWREGEGPGLTNDHARQALDGRHILPLAFLAGAADRRSYLWRASGEAGELLIVNDHRETWRLGQFRNQADAARLAAWVRRRALHCARASEGMHVVEPILLRWRARKEDLTQLAFRATLVLPNWTSRTGRQEFQDFVAELASQEAPAHTMVRCLWLGPVEMLAFERDYDAWLGTLHGYCQEDGAVSASELDSAAGPVRRAIGLEGADA